MISIKPKDDNRIALIAPENWDHEKGRCNTLYAVPVDLFGTYTLASLWEPSDDEIRAILAGHPIMLFVCGKTHPPVALGVASEFDRVGKE